jgi:hypothetical protein
VLRAVGRQVRADVVDGIGTLTFTEPSAADRRVGGPNAV